MILNCEAVQIKKLICSWAVVAHTFDASTWEVELCETEVSLIYRASSSTARATQRNPVSKKQ